jgi:hypothetical protein
MKERNLRQSQSTINMATTNRTAQLVICFSRELVLTACCSLIDRSSAFLSDEGSLRVDLKNDVVLWQLARSLV